MTSRRWATTRLSVLVVPVVLVAVGCAGPRPSGSRPDDAAAAVERSRTRLLTSIEDVAGSTAHRYGVTDDLGHEMDTVKIIAIPESGGFVGLSHSFHDGTYDVNLATSTDLMTWTWRVRLATRASMPTIKPASDGGYAVAWEQEPDNHLRFSYYPSWDALLRGAPTKSLDAPQRLSGCAEGTPNLYAASSTALDVGFHFFDRCELDRQARGATDWTTWDPAPRPTIENAVRANRVTGGVGDRDVIRFGDADLTLVEGQVVKDDWRSWRIFLYDEVTGRAEPVDFHTDAMSFAFTNPTIERITIGGREAVLVSLFIPGEGALGGEAGELIYYRTL